MRARAPARRRRARTRQRWPVSSYLAFLAPGLLASTAMQTAASESTFPVMAGIVWVKSFHGMIATPIRPSDVVVGKLVYIGLRLAARGGRLLRRQRGVRRDQPAARPSSRCPAALLTGPRLRRPDRRLLGDPAGHERLQQPLPLRGHPALPLLRDVLPDQPAAGAPPAAWRCSRRSGTGWTSAARWPSGPSSRAWPWSTSPTSGRWLPLGIGRVLRDLPPPARDVRPGR